MAHAPAATMPRRGQGLQGPYQAPAACSATPAPEQAPLMADPLRFCKHKYITLPAVCAVCTMPESQGLALSKLRFSLKFMFWFKNSLPNALYSQTRLQQLPQIPVKASDYTVLERPTSFHQRILELISQARERIMMTMLYLQDDEAGNEIMQALYEAQKRNPQLYIRVYVDFHRAQRGLIGGKGEQRTNAQMYASYAADVDHPPAVYGVPVKRRELFGVMHLKGFVFDDTVLYSGASINKVYLNYNKEKYRLDRYHEIHSRELADTMCHYTNEAFHQNFAVQDFSQGNIRPARDIRGEIKALQRSLARSQYSFKSSRRIKDDEVGITPLAGLGKRNNQLNRSILWALDSARKQIFICTPYFNPPRILQEHLEMALDRDVEVTIVVGDKVANDFYIPPEQNFSTIGAIPYVYEQNLRDLLTRQHRHIESGKLNVYLWRDGINTYHLKGIFIDRHLAVITGNNLNPRAWGLDLENGLFVHDPNHLLQEKFMHEKQYILRHTTRMNSVNDLEKFEDYPEQVQKILKKVRRLRASFILKKLL